MSDGSVYQYELHGLDIPGGHQTPPSSRSPSDSEGEAVVLVFVGQQVIIAAVVDQLTVGALVGGRPLTEEAGPLPLPALGLALALLSPQREAPTRRHCPGPVSSLAPLERDLAVRTFHSAQY